MSIPMNESDPLNVYQAKALAPCSNACGVCEVCVNYMRSGAFANVQVKDKIGQPNLKSRAEFYQVALREEGEAKEALRKAQADLAKAEEALNDASAQLTLTRDGLFKACGL